MSSCQITEKDLWHFQEGTFRDSYRKLGAHLCEEGGKTGTRFAVWAPNASEVSVVGDFNHWDAASHRLQPMGGSGIWTGFVPGAKQGHKYKYAITANGRQVQKADPYAFHSETPPQTASVIWDLGFSWSDQDWMAKRPRAQAATCAMSIYEMHLGSWKRRREGQFPTYLELAEELPAYLKQQGFTHVEFMPPMEHPFYGSWGYQVTSYFAPSSRYGTPQDFMKLINALHQEGIGVILDWVPSHFPEDEHGLGSFDGTHLYEHADPRKGYHPDWKSLIFNYGRTEVKNFLISNALFWLDYFHIDGLRVDAVASMLYLDYSRAQGEWIPNAHGGRENLEAISFLKELNEAAYQAHPDIHMIAEESTAWPMVSRPTYLGGLGFGMKWDMGWMHDSLSYFREDPVHRKYHHNLLTFRSVYAFHENFVLSLSHDEVVYGKGSLFGKMPGDDWRKYANLRTLYAWMYAQPGKKLLFMGGEFGQRKEWNHDSQLEWELLENPANQGLMKLVADLNQAYRKEAALHATDFSPEGFRWMDHHDPEQSVLIFLREGGGESIIVAFNLTPMPRGQYRIGAPRAGTWLPLMNTDHPRYGGTGDFMFENLKTEAVPCQGQGQSVVLNLPPLAAVYLKWQGERR